MKVELRSNYARWELALYWTCPRDKFSLHYFCNEFYFITSLFIEYFSINSVHIFLNFIIVNLFFFSVTISRCTVRFQRLYASNEEVHATIVRLIVRKLYVFWLDNSVFGNFYGLWQTILGLFYLLRGNFFHIRRMSFFEFKM